MSKKPVILHVISSLKVGGAEHVLCDLVEGLSDEYDQHVAYFHKGPLLERLTDLGVQTHSLKGLFCPYEPLSILKFLMLVSKIKPDLVHSSLWLANVFSMFFGPCLEVPTIISLHNNLEQDGVFRNFIYKIILKFPCYVVAVSQEVFSGFKRKFPEFPANKSFVIKNGIENTI